MTNHHDYNTFSGPRQSGPHAKLPFSELQVWHNVHLQQKSYHHWNELGPMFTINTHPPDWTWKYGQYDGAILQVDLAHQWPPTGLTGMIFLHEYIHFILNCLGHSVILVYLIMCPAFSKHYLTPWASCALIYTQRLDVVPQGNSQTEFTTGLHVLRRTKHTSSENLGEVFPLDHLRSYAHIVPCFGHAANNCLTNLNSIHTLELFLLNKYFDKDIFYAISEVLWCMYIQLIYLLHLPFCMAHLRLTMCAPLQEQEHSKTQRHAWHFLSSLR